MPVAAPQPGSRTAAPLPKRWDVPPAMALKPDTNYTATLATTQGDIGVQLLPGIAPNAVNNFVFLAREGFYKDVPIHRVIGDFMFQSGDPTGTGMGGPGYNIPDDAVPPGLNYSKGVVAMANTGAPNSGGSQFFVMLGDVPLPPTYSIFGLVTSGQDVLDKIATTPVADNGQGEVSRPTVPIGIRDVAIAEAALRPPADATPAPPAG